MTEVIIGLLVGFILGFVVACWSADSVTKSQIKAGFMVKDGTLYRIERHPHDD